MLGFLCTFRYCRLEKERDEERKAEEAAAAQEATMSKRKKRKRGKEFEVPRAPRNTTQNLLHTDSDLYDDDVQNVTAQAPTSTMFGLLSRETMGLKNVNEDSSDSSEEEESERWVNILCNHSELPLRARQRFVCNVHFSLNTCQFFY